MLFYIALILFSSLDLIGLTEKTTLYNIREIKDQNKSGVKLRTIINLNGWQITRISLDKNNKSWVKKKE